MKSKKPPKPTAEPQTVKVPVHYIKSNYFRVIHSDGIFGGISPQGGIQIAFFSERAPIPQQTTHIVDVVTGELLGEDTENRIERKGMIREVEVNVLMDLNDAETLQTWLTQRIADLRKIIEKREKKNG